jgi:hypothetical protein
MPLYKIKDVGFDNFPLVDGAHLRVMWSRVITMCNRYLMINGIYPTIYVCKESYEILSQSSSFIFNNYHSERYLGHFMDWSVYLTDKLYDDEYFLGIYEFEIERYRRKDKLKQIINKLNATV